MVTAIVFDEKMSIASLRKSDLAEAFLECRAPVTQFMRGSQPPPAHSQQAKINDRYWPGKYRKFAQR